MQKKSLYFYTMEEKTRIKKCRECGIEFYGRLNQYFCSNKCRFDFNNSIARNNKEQINSILKILMRNREILKAIFETETTEISRTDLGTKRYNFTYLTHQLKTVDGKNYIFSFDYGYSVSGDTLKLTKYDGNF